MFSFLKNILHTLIIKSGFFYYFLLPIVKRVFMRMPIKGNNHYIVDEGGSKFRVTKYQGKTFPPFPPYQLSTIKDFHVRHSDILIAGYPKTGCHWLYEILYMMLNKTLSHSKHGKEFGGMFDLIPGIILDSVPSPRILNSHLLYDELPHGIKAKRTKIILTVRCAKDTVISYYNHNKNLVHVYGGYNGKFENYFKLFMTGQLEYGDFFEFYHDWVKVISSDPVNDIFLMDFSDLKKDPVSMIKRLAKFLEQEITHQVAVDISEASSFKNMKKARSADLISSLLLRKGVVGDWKNWMDDRQKEEMDSKWTSVEKECKAVMDSQNGSGS